MAVNLILTNSNVPQDMHYAEFAEDEVSFSPSIFFSSLFFFF